MHDQLHLAERGPTDTGRGRRARM